MTQSINITLGTAGHIDHGKTALIKCLTGCETDNLKAEKERGMSIDLGFAPCTISEMEVGIVDVPGHENFVKTMVAGAAGMDGVIFVVAADDGVMPQTREHLEILTLLGLTHGIVALTKIDRVDPRQREMVTAQLSDFLKGTFLEDAPIAPMSNITGEGFDYFFEALKELVASITPKRSNGLFRMPVDRAFSAKGYGTIVAGIPVSGTVKVGEEVVLLPHGQKGRIKSVQVYKHDSDTALAGQCAALNIPQLEYGLVTRGNVITVDKYFSPQMWYLCRLRLLAHNKLFLKNGQTVKFHTGTSQVPATIYLMKGDKLDAGQGCLVQIRLNEPIVAGPADRFILRTLSPVRTIGGGTIIEALPERIKRNRPHIYQDLTEQAEEVLSENSFVEFCIKKAESLVAGPGEISQRCKIPPHLLPEILDKLTDQGRIIKLSDNLYLHSDIADESARQILDAVARFHRQSPQSPGIPRQELLEFLDLHKKAFDFVLNRILQNNQLDERGNRLAMPKHQVTFAGEDSELFDTVESLYRQCLFNPPGQEEVAEKTALDKEKVRHAVKMLIEHEHLVQVDRSMIFHADAIEQARELLVDFITKEGKLESVKFKYLVDTTRKYALPLLDYMDRIGVTRRVGNTRYLRTTR